MHSPNMLTGLRRWLLAILLPISERQAMYHLPVIHCEKGKSLNLHVLMWILSGVLSSIFLGGVNSHAAGGDVQVSNNGSHLSCESHPQPLPPS